jgi:hypothetical protein
LPVFRRQTKSFLTKPEPRMPETAPLLSVIIPL